MNEFSTVVTFTVIQCANCGIDFGITKDYEKRRRDDHARFYCPAGHTNMYHGPSEAERLRQQLEREKQVREAAEAREALAQRESKRVTRAHQQMRVRIANGVCPCCQRTFQNLMRHMATEHPEFGKPQTLTALRKAFGMTQADIAKEAGVEQPQVSAFEHNRPVPARALQRLEAWVEKHQHAKAGE